MAAAPGQASRSQWLNGATAARLTPDQKVGSSNLSWVRFVMVAFGRPRLLVGGSRSVAVVRAVVRSVAVGRWLSVPPPSSVSNQAADHPTKQASKHQSFVIPHQEQARPHAHAHRLFSQVEWVPICSTTSQITLFCDLHTRDGTRTHNLLLRREAPYPLGHTSVGTGKVDLLHFELLGSCGV